MKFAWCNARNFNDSDTVMLGVPDESGSHAKRKGASRGPNVLRRISNERYVFARGGKKSVALSHSFLRKKLFDYGNVKKSSVSGVVEKIIKNGKLPVTVGGDHSITFEVLKGIDKLKKSVSVIYFDAHPDFVCSSQFYYGSVVCDVKKLKNVNLKKSFEIGNRVVEKEEFVNLKKSTINVISPHDFIEQGVNKVFKKIKDKVGNNVYLSIDLDVVDPAFAPGVDTPVPGGLSSNELISLVRKISKLNLIGFDIMELSPPNDIKDMTSDLAAKLILEVLSK